MRLFPAEKKERLWGIGRHDRPAANIARFAFSLDCTNPLRETHAMKAYALRIPKAKMTEETNPAD